MPNPKQLTPQQQTAAKLIANGKSNLETADLLNVSESTILRWKRLKAFHQTVEGYKTAAAREQLENLLPTDDDEINAAKQTEQAHLKKLDELIEKLACLSLGIFDACEPEDVSPRALPGLLKAFTGLIECRRIGVDRIVGLEQILDELGKAEEIFSEKIAPNSSRG